MVNGVAAAGLSLRPYFNRYTEDAIDLRDVLSSFGPQAKATLHELSRVMELPGKPDGMSGVEKYYRQGQIRESLSIARAMSSTPTAFCCDTNCFGDDCPIKRFKPAR
jgi:hypothetical protein